MPHHGSKAGGKAQAKLLKKYWKRVRSYRWLFQICPYLSWVGVCNSLPMKKLKKGSDIDLFIVTKPGHLFTARLWITAFTSLFGVRRHGKKTEQRFCLSFFIEQGHEDLSPIAIEEDIYLGQWVQTLMPISGDFRAYEKFVSSNQNWTKELVGPLKLQKKEWQDTPLLYKTIQKFLEFVSWPWEPLLRYWQLKRAQKKAAQLKDNSGTIVSRHCLKFHDKDQRVALRDKWRQERRRAL